MTAALIDARDTPACRALGRRWWKQHGRTLTPWHHDIRPRR